MEERRPKSPPHDASATEPPAGPPPVTPAERPSYETFMAEHDAREAARLTRLRARYPGGYHAFGTPAPTERLRFEALTRANAARFRELFADHGDDPFLDPRFSEGAALGVYLDFLLEACPWSSKHAGVDYLVRLRGEGTYVGVLHLYDVSREIFADAPYGYTLGFAIARPYRGRGLGAEATRALLAHARDRLGRTRALAYTEPGNDAALGLLRRLGFRDAQAEYDPDGRGRQRYLTKHMTADTDQLPTHEYGAPRRHLIECVPKGFTLFEALTDSQARLEARLGELFPTPRPDAGIYRSPTPPARRLAALVDAERLAAYQLLHLARGLPGDPPDPAEGALGPGEHDYPSLARVRSAFAKTRAATLALLEDLDEEDYTRRGRVQAVEATVRGLGFALAGRTYALAESLDAEQPVAEQLRSATQPLPHGR